MLFTIEPRYKCVIFNKINEMENNGEYLILDAAEGVGYAFIQSLIRKKIPATLVVEGQARDAGWIDKVCEGKKFLFISYESLGTMDHAIRYAALEQVIRICTKKNIAILYSVSSSDAWLYSSKQLELPIEEILLDATVNDGARVTTFRFSNCWGPKMADQMLERIFRDAVKKRKLWYPVDPDIRSQFVYTEDAAEVIYRLARAGNKNPWQVYNYGGTTYTTARSFLRRIAEIAGCPKRIGIIGKWQIRVRSKISKRMRQLNNRIRHYKEGILLDDSETSSLLTDFNPTPIDKAIENTLAWYKNNV